MLTKPTRKRRPYFGWKDCKLHLFNAKLATPQQRKALAKFEGVRINEDGGGTACVEACLLAQKLGLTLGRGA
jgi:hypothetical protein